MKTVEPHGGRPFVWLIHKPEPWWRRMLQRLFRRRRDFTIYQGPNLTIKELGVSRPYKGEPKQ